jgi:general transcription factor 3C polypeptide 3 (transcription factor C subunit 4)
MDIGEFETLADFLLKEKKWDHVIKVIRTGVRWLGGREKETIWDQLEDDREFDVRRQERDGWEKVARALEESPVHQLDNRLRLRLGLARMGKGDIEEARVSYIFCVFWFLGRGLMWGGAGRVRCTLRS